MATISIYRAKALLSELIQRATAGEEIILASRGKPVARLVPVAAAPGTGTPSHVSLPAPEIMPPKPANRAAPGRTLAEITAAGL